MGTAERKSREKEKLRATILDTAWQMVKEEGWQSLSIRKIADAIEYSVPFIYQHFENKEAILFEFGKEGFKLLAKKIQAAREKTDDPEEQLRLIAFAYWDFAFKNKELFQLMYGLGMQGCEMEKCLPEKAIFRKLVIGPIIKLIEKGNNPKAEPYLKYFTYWSILHGLVTIKNIRGNAVSDEINKMVMEDAVNGFIKNLG